MTDKPSDDKLAADSGQDSSTGGITRRDLLYLGGLTAGALAVPTVLQNLNPTSATTAPRDRYEADVLVVGSGFAGVFAAVEAAKMGQRVVLVDKGTVGWSGMTPWASDSRPFDPELYDRKEWLDNLSTATEWLYNRPWIERFMDESMDIFWTLRGWGTHDCRPFERSTVFRRVLLENNVELVERVMLTKLVQDDSGRIGGAVGFTFDDSSEPSKAVVFQCEGRNPRYRRGVLQGTWFSDLESDVRWRCDGLRCRRLHHRQRISRYPRNAQHLSRSFLQQLDLGAGGNRRVHHGGPAESSGGWDSRCKERWVFTLAVASMRAVAVADRAHQAQGDREAVADQAVRARNRSPGTGPMYEGRGFLKLPDLTIDWGDVPGQDDGHEPPPGHAVGGATFGMGVHKGEGVFSHNDDYSCQADGVEGLYAAGDALGSMMVGTAYPGRGFSSYGSAIQGRRAGRFAAEYASNVAAPQISSSAFDAKIAETWAPREVERGYTPAWVIRTLQNTMSPIHVLYIKSQRRLDGALASIEYLREHVVPKMIARDGHELRVAHEAANMLLNAEMKLRAGMYRKESRGTHFIEEYPARDDRNWLCWVLQRKENGRMVESKYPLPADWGPPQSMAYRERYPRVFPGEDEFLRDNPDWMET